MTIHPGFAPLFEMMEPLADIDWAGIPATELRGFFDNPMAQGEPLAMARVEELTIPVAGTTLAARLYVPETAPHAPPLTVFFHGGGWVIGTLDTHDATCRALADASGSALLSVAYRLAPEHRYPVAAHDCFAATCWAAANAARLELDETKLAVAGDSAGGNLAAAVALMARDAGEPALRHQLLIYPVTDHDLSRSSYAAHAAPSSFLPLAAMQRFWKDYLGGHDPDDTPLATILRRDDLAGVPSATIVIAEHDPLRDEGAAYAARLGAAGVPTRLIDAPGMIHGFFGMAELVPEAGHTIAAAAGCLSKALA